MKPESPVLRAAVPLAGMLLLAAAWAAPAQDRSDWTGRRLMQEVDRFHHQYPYVYEEESLVLVDRDGNRDTRLARRYSRVEADGTVHFLLVFTAPREVSGVSLLASRDPDGGMHTSVYLPAYGHTLINSSIGGRDEKIMGTDFSIEDLTGENIDDYRYVRRRDTRLNNTDYYVVDVFARGSDPASSLALRRHYILPDNLFIIRTDYFDSLGRVTKRLTRHDLQQLNGDMWRANMILMQDLAERHQTLIKIDRRVYSRDYVPAEMFSGSWLFRHYPGTPPPETGKPDNAQDAGKAPAPSGAAGEGR